MMDIAKSSQKKEKAEMKRTNQTGAMLNQPTTQDALHSSSILVCYTQFMWCFVPAFCSATLSLNAKGMTRMQKEIVIYTINEQRVFPEMESNGLLFWNPITCPRSPRKPPRPLAGSSHDGFSLCASLQHICRVGQAPLTFGGSHEG